MPTRSNRHTNNKPKSSKEAVATDVYHNSDQPNCLLLQAQAQHLIDDTTDTTLFSILKLSLLDVVPPQQSSKKPKKKKKKKQKPTTRAPTPAEDTEGTANSTAPVAAVVVVEEEQPSFPAPLSIQEQYQTTVHQMVVRLTNRFLSRQTPSVNTGNTASPSSVLQDFLRAHSERCSVLDTLKVQQVVEMIECQACRRDVQRALGAETQTQVIQLRGVYWQSKKTMDPQQLDEHQYCLMEEGISPSDTNLRFGRDCNSQSWKLQTAEEDAFSCMDFLTRHYLILQGLSPDTVLDCTIVISEESMQEIEHTATAKSDQCFKDFDRMRQVLNKAELKFQNTQSHGDQPTEWKSFVIMKEADEAADDILDTLLRIMFDVTKAAHCCSMFGENAQDVEWMQSRITSLWKVYLEGIHRILENLGTFHPGLFALANHTNSLPPVFNSIEVRRLYRSFVASKIDTVQTIMHSIEQHLQHATHIGNWSSQYKKNYYSCNFVRRLFFEDCYIQYLMREQHLERPRSVPLDRAFQDVLTTVRELAAFSELAHKVDKILEMHTQRLEKLSRLCYTVSMNVAVDAENSHIVDIGNIVNSLWFSSNELSPESKVQDIQQARLRMTEGVTAATLHWIQYKAELDTKCAPVMPHSLRKRLRIDPTGGRCLGGSGADRAASILVGVYFSQLSDAFREWHAQVAADELLTVLEDDKARAEKKAKRKKSKKDKIQAKSEVDKVSESGQTMETTLDEPVILTEKSNTMCGGENSVGGDRIISSTKKPKSSVDEQQLSEQVESRSSSSVEQTSVVKKVKDIPLQRDDMDSSETTSIPSKPNPMNGKSEKVSQNDPKHTNEDRTNDKSAEITKSGEDHVAEKAQRMDGGSQQTIGSTCRNRISGKTYSRVKMGIQSESGFQSAEAFFTRRLDELLGSGEELEWA